MGCSARPSSTTTRPSPARQGRDQDWEFLYKTANAERNRLEYENKAMGASFDALFQKAYATEVQLRNLRHDRRLFAATERLKRKAGDCGLAASLGPKKPPPSESFSGEPSLDLRWLAAETKDDAWLQVGDRWGFCPLDLRWLAVATNDRSWLLNRFVWKRSPRDLQWMSVATYSREWLLLGASNRWEATPPAVKLRAIQSQDPNLARPSLSEAVQRSLDACIRSDIQREMDIREEAYQANSAQQRQAIGVGIPPFDSFRLSAADLTAEPELRKPFTSLPTAAETQKKPAAGGASAGAGAGAAGGAAADKGASTSHFPKEGTVPASKPPSANSAPPPSTPFVPKTGSIPIKKGPEETKAPGALPAKGAPKAPAAAAGTAPAAGKGGPLAGKSAPSPAGSKPGGAPLGKTLAPPNAKKDVLSGAKTLSPPTAPPGGPAADTSAKGPPTAKATGPPTAPAKGAGPTAAAGKGPLAAAGKGPLPSAGKGPPTAAAKGEGLPAPKTLGPPTTKSATAPPGLTKTTGPPAASAKAKSEGPPGPPVPKKETALPPKKEVPSPATGATAAKPPERDSSTP
ncbi:hypothetical protein, conserved [Eimeria praecox]|uniref:Uncharacterized protein n=1 Tax=Eimeria praecox TaxID=51316 RepID=U6G6Z9_9EIME|nr:hypothetical protein, conserved [Eimeria praecox]